MKRTEDSLRGLWDIRCTNLQIIGVPEEQKEKEPEKKYLKTLYVKTSLIWGGNSVLIAITMVYIHTHTYIFTHGQISKCLYPST